MPRFPYFTFPSSYYRKYNYNSTYNYGHESSNNQNIKNSNSNSYTKSINNEIINFEHNKDNKSKSNIDDTFLFDIFGLKIYLDDVIIVALLFFLYQEEVQDEGLFIALVLLLLT